MEIPKGMESKFDDKKKDILSKIDLDKVTSPYARLLLKLLSYGVTFEQVVNIKTPMVLAQAYPWCKPLEDYIVDYVSNDRGRIGPEYFLGYKPRKEDKSLQQSVKACVRGLRIVLIPQGVTLPMLRYLGDVKPGKGVHTRRISDKDPADQLLSLLRGRIGPEYFLGIKPRDKESQQQSVKACVRALRIVLIPQGITLPMLRYLGDVKNTPQHRTRKVKGKDPADQLLSLLRGRITGDEYDKLVNKVKAIQQEERKADNDARQPHRKQTSKDDNEYEPTAAQPQQN